MAKGRQAKKGKTLERSPVAHYCGWGPEEWGQMGQKVMAPVDESMRRFVKCNRENVERSRKGKIASASYCGGMIDMIIVVRNALGNWAVGEMLGELERWHMMTPAERTPGVTVNVPTGPGAQPVSSEDAKELEYQIAKWLEKRKGGSTRRGKDPIFA
jgi:hypothetical protein